MIKLKVLFDAEYTSYLKEGKQEANLLTRAIKADPNLKNYWMIMNNLQEGECKPEDVSMFINENISMIRDVDMTLINEMASKFADPEYNEVEAAINTLVFESKTPSNIQRFIDANGLLHSHLVSNYEKSRKMENLHETLSKLTEHKIIKEYMECENREDFMGKKKQEAKEYLQSLLEGEQDNETRLLIFENLNKIDRQGNSPENFVQNILAIDELLND